jgi:hypothetical protein
MKAGPKAAVDPTVLPFRPRSLGAARFAKFCERHVKVPKGTGARTPLRLRDWQRDVTVDEVAAEVDYQVPSAEGEPRGVPMGGEREPRGWPQP